MNKKIITILFVIQIFSIVLIGCVTNEENRVLLNDKYVFKGQNELWAVELVINKKGSNNNEFEKIFTIKYKGELSELTKIKTLSYSYETNSGSKGSASHIFDTPPMDKVFTKRTIGKGKVIRNTKEIINANIVVDGNIQKIELRNQID